MKKTPVFLLIVLTIPVHIHAQKDLKKDPKKPDTAMLTMVPVNTLQQVNSNIIYARGITVYEKPNYQGRTAQFIKNGKSGKFEFPFPLTHVSFRVPAGTALYIKNCSDEFATETAYFKSQTDINLSGICGVRTDEADTIRVTFTGISTEVHNHDCLRFSGSIVIQLNEYSPGESVFSLMPMYGRAASSSAQFYTYTPFDWDTDQLTNTRYAPQYLNVGTIYNNNPVPDLSEQAHNRFGSTRAQYNCVFYVGKTALRTGRVNISVRTDLRSSHKTCDLCDDFSSNIKMPSPRQENIPLNKIYSGDKIVNASHPNLVVGPYAANGSRDGSAITATSGTFKNFRVHLRITGL